jgi:hypothetical protein
MSRAGLVSPTLEDTVALAVYETTYAGLATDERDAARTIVETLTDWFEDNWREWLEQEDGSMPEWYPNESDHHTGWAEGFDAALEAVRDEFRASDFADRPVVERVGKKLAELREEGPADV